MSWNVSNYIILYIWWYYVYHVDSAIFVTYFLIGIQLLCMGIHVIVQEFHFSMMRICVDDHRCSELRYGLCNKDHAGQSQLVDNEHWLSCYNPKPVIFARLYKGFYCKSLWVIVIFLAVGAMREYYVFPMVFQWFRTPSGRIQESEMFHKQQVL